MWRTSSDVFDGVWLTLTEDFDRAWLMLSVSLMVGVQQDVADSIRGFSTAYD